jgi:hypothetical protein
MEERRDEPVVRQTDAMQFGLTPIFTIADQSYRIPLQSVESSLNADGGDDSANLLRASL